MNRKPLTPHQKGILNRLTARYEHRLRNPAYSMAGSTPAVPEEQIGSVGALNHLAAKGYARVVHKEYGPRGGDRRFWIPMTLDEWRALGGGSWVGRTS